MMECRKQILVAAVLSILCFAPGCGGNSSTACNCTNGGGKNFVYTANAAGNPSTVSALSSDATTGALTAISGSPYSTGSGSMALAADPGGKFLYVANYFSGNISQFSINHTTGALSPVAGGPVAAEPGMDSLAIDPTGAFLYAVTDNSENLWAYSITSSGALNALAGTPIAIAPSGTQSSAVMIDPSGKYLYVANRSSSSASLYGFSRNTTTGAITALSAFPVALDGVANKGRFDPAGKFLLVTGTNVFLTVGGVDVFSLNASTGALTLTSGSPVQVRDDPAGVVVDASGKYVYVANTADATISEFTLDGTSGALTKLSGSPIASGGNGNINGPLGIATDDTGHFVYVSNASNDISVFSINSSNGVLTPISGSPFADGGNAPSAIIFVP
jgi:6-phosphogluconolactonase (cycloisomerase 2 family)